MRKLAILLVAFFSQTSHADEWVRIDKTDELSSGTRTVAYIDRASITRDDDKLAFEQFVIGQEGTAHRPVVRSSRVVFDCEWQTVRYGARISSASPAPTTTSPQRESFATADILKTGTSLCAGTTPEGDALATETAMLDEAARRLGSADWATASSLPAKPQYVLPAPPRPPQRPLSDQEFVVVFPATDGRTIIAPKASLKRDGNFISGESIWVANAGVKPQRYEFHIRAYSRRAFLANCGDGTIALETLATGPEQYVGDPPAGPPDTPPSKPRTGSASAALWAVACTDAPTQSLASATEFFAYVEAPDEDPAFHALRQIRYPHDQVRWVKTPSPEDLAASLGASGANLTELKWTSIWCVVTRDYKLSDCEITTSSSYHKELDEAHLALAERYAPQAMATDGKDIAGRTIEATIEWRAEGARLKPFTYKQAAIIWERTPSEHDIQRATPLNVSSQIELRCTVSRAYELTDCTPPSLTVFRTQTLIGIFHDLRMTGPELTEQRTKLAKTVRDRVLPLIPKFKPSRLSQGGEDLAGQYVDLTFVWK